MQVQVKFLDSEFMVNFYFSKDPAETAREAFRKDQYRVVSMEEYQSLECVQYMDDEDIAEDLFDLTNNPSRQYQREALYGRGRSISVGDVVTVNGRSLLCASIGWVRIS